MNLEFLRLATPQRTRAINETAARTKNDPVIVEKDFWVCWLLGVLF